VPIHAPAYTQFPNEILEAIPELSESEFKVMAILVRNTLGFHRQSVQLTMQDLKRQTGLSINSVRAGVMGCIQRQWIRQNSQKPYTYSIWLEYGSKSDPSKSDGSKSDPSMDQNLIHDGSKFDPSMDQILILSSNKGFKENSKESASLLLKKADPEGEARENSLRSPEPDPNLEPVAQHLSSPVQSASTDQPAQQGGVSVPPPAAPGFDPFARRGMPHVVPIQAQFEGPWGRGYTPELQRFEAWLLANKARGKSNPSGWIAAVVDGIAKGGSRALWTEFERFEAGDSAPAQPKRERSPAMKKFLGIA
jgi:hypothetical protein